jgi:diaminohydroxyphosphoribosylaminopyrimidine deaminase/5-amino-6-(5-phosphoribosylamino)uracil reductase
MSDLAHMRRALELAGQAAGLTSPNPMVGAVVVRDGVVVGEGYHRAAGEAHAEVEALRAAGARARGATLYVTLEPCSHHGRTPPCAPLLVEAGVARVVVAMGDPNPRVSGRGLELLRRAGIAVDQGVATDEARRLNRAFCTWVTQGRPHVTLKSAVTLDGKIADVHGGSRWITGEDARAETHRLRSLSDAILVGIRTALADDPALTVRLPQPWPREPYRIVLDPRARLSPEARVLMSGTPAKTIVAVGDQASSEALERLRISGATVVHCPPDGAGLDLRHLLRWLAARDIASLLVEGGGETSATFLESGLVDRVAVFVAPMLLGGRAAPTAVGGQGRALKDALRLRDVTVRTLGADVLIEGDVETGT